jgi:hypothetical protein
LLAIFKNSRTNVPYIKIVNNESCWFVNGKLIGPSVVDGVYNAYTNNEMDYLLDSKISQSFQIIATVQDQDGKSVFELSPNAKTLTLKWDTYYEGRKVQPNYLGISRATGDSTNDTFTDYTNTNQLVLNAKETTHYKFKAKYGQLEHVTTITVHFVNPIFFGEIKCNTTTTYNNHNHSMDNGVPNIQVDPEVYPHMAAMDFDWVTEDKIKALSKYISNTQEHSYEITTDQQNPGHIVYAYPKDFGQLSYINDYDGYLYYNFNTSMDDNDVICLTRQITPIEELTDNHVDYYVYIFKEPSYVYKQIIKFKKAVTLKEWI